MTSNIFKSVLQSISSNWFLPFFLVGLENICNLWTWWKTIMAKSMLLNIASCSITWLGWWFHQPLVLPSLYVCSKFTAIPKASSRPWTPISTVHWAWYWQFGPLAFWRVGKENKRKFNFCGIALTTRFPSKMNELKNSNSITHSTKDRRNLKSWKKK